MAFERERIVHRSAPAICSVCDSTGGLLTTAEAAALAKVTAQSIYRWLTQGKAHGVKTCGGQYRICKDSIFNSCAKANGLLNELDIGEEDNDQLDI